MAVLVIPVVVMITVPACIALCVFCAIRQGKCLQHTQEEYEHEGRQRRIAQLRRQRDRARARERERAARRGVSWTDSKRRVGGQLSRPSAEERFRRERDAAAAAASTSTRRSSQKRRGRVDPTAGGAAAAATDLELTAVGEPAAAPAWSDVWIDVRSGDVAKDVAEPPKGAALKRARAHQERMRERLAIERRERREAEAWKVEGDDDAPPPLEPAAEAAGSVSACATCCGACETIAEQEDTPALPDVTLEWATDDDSSSTHSSSGGHSGRSACATIPEAAAEEPTWTDDEDESSTHSSGRSESAELAGLEAHMTACADGVRGLSLDERIAAAPPAVCTTLYSSS